MAEVTSDQDPLTDNLGIGLTARAALILQRGQNIVTFSELCHHFHIRSGPGETHPHGPGAESSRLWLVPGQGYRDGGHLHQLLQPHPAPAAAGDCHPAHLQHLLHHGLDQNQSKVAL